MQPLSIPWLQAETIMAAMELLDERDTAPNIVDLFTPRMFVGKRLSIPQIRYKAGRVRHTTAGGPAMPVTREEIELHEYDPSWIKLDDHITPDDKSAFHDALSPVIAGYEAMRDARLMEADAIAERIASRLRASLRMEKRALCAGALRGSYTYRLGDAASDKTVNLQLTALTNPSTDWDNAAATIPLDVAGWINEFKDNNDQGLLPTHVFYNPRGIRGYFMANTQFQTMIGASAMLAEWFIGLRAGTTGDWLDIEGRIRDPLWSLTWVPVDGTSKDLAGSVADLWPSDKLTFARITNGGREDSATPFWAVKFDREQTPTIQPRIEVKAPASGEAVKNHDVVLFHNGLPAFERPDLVMTVDVNNT